MSLSNDIVTADSPVVRAARQSAESLCTMEYGLVIRDVSGFESGAETLARIKGALNELDETRKSITSPMNQAVKRVNALFASPLNALESAERSIKTKLIAWQRHQDELARERQSVLDEEARKQREKLEVQAAKAAVAGKAERAAELAERAAMVVAPIVETDAPKVSGFSTRPVVRYEVLDLAEVPEQFKMLDDKRVAALCRSLGMDAQALLPGIRVYEETIAVSRSAP